MCYKEFIADHVTFSQSGGGFIAMDCIESRVEHGRWREAQIAADSFNEICL